MPDDPFISEMDPVQKIWMFQNWVEDRNEKIESDKNNAYLLASFSHPEKVKKLLEGDTFISTDEEFEESTKLVREINLKNLSKKKKKRRKYKIKD